MLVALLGLVASAGASARPDDTLVIVDDRPTTLLPLYAATGADRRLHELVYDRLFYDDGIT